MGEKEVILEEHPDGPALGGRLIVSPGRFASDQPGRASVGPAAHRVGADAEQFGCFATE